MSPEIGTATIEAANREQQRCRHPECEHRIWEEDLAGRGWCYRQLQQGWSSHPRSHGVWLSVCREFERWQACVRSQSRHWRPANGPRPLPDMGATPSRSELRVHVLCRVSESRGGHTAVHDLRLNSHLQQQEVSDAAPEVAHSGGGLAWRVYEKEIMHAGRPSMHHRRRRKRPGGYR